MAERRRLVLASASPARLRVLRDAGFDPEVAVSGVAEDVTATATADAVAALAARKAAAVTARHAPPDALVLGCDSLLDLAGTAFGKPRSPGEAIEFWRARAGRAATLYTGHHLIDTVSGRQVSAVAATVVRFGRTSDEELAAYVATGEPLGLAGGFSLEGRSGPFVDGIEGDPSNVLGLSLPTFRRMLADLGISVIGLWRDAGAR